MLSDPYAELGVAPTATTDDIRRAYRQLAKELHPDARPNDLTAEERFKRVTAAFHFLNDPGRRRRFDRGDIDAEGNSRARRRSRRDPREERASGAFSGADTERGEDTRYRLELDFVEAAIGGRKRVVMKDGKALDLSIPEGVKTGQTLRLKGQGRSGRRGAPPGDAYVEISVAQHPYFSRAGDDIYMDAPVTLKEAVLGAKIRVPTVEGLVTVTVPRGSNSGDVLRLRGRGVKGEKGRGDQLVKLVVHLPQRNDADLARFLEDWEPSRPDEPRRHFET